MGEKKYGKRIIYSGKMETVEGRHFICYRARLAHYGKHRLFLFGCVYNTHYPVGFSGNFNRCMSYQ
jgi:hypothetical protein